MGYGSNQCGYRCLEPQSQKVYLSQSVVFDESNFPAKGLALSLGSYKVMTPRGNPTMILPSNFLHAPHVSTYPSIDVSGHTLPPSLTKLTPPPTKQPTLQTSHPPTLQNSFPRSTSSPPIFQSSTSEFVLQDTFYFHLAPSPPSRDIDTIAMSIPTLACTPSPASDFVPQDTSPLHFVTSPPSPVRDIASTSNPTHAYSFLHSQLTSCPIFFTTCHPYCPYPSRYHTFPDK